MIASKYLQAFTRFGEARPKGKLYGSKLLIEVVNGDDLYKTRGGIILGESSNVRSDFVMLKSTVGIVLEVGAGYFDPDTKEDVPLSAQVGNVISVPAMALSYITTLPILEYGIPEKVFAYVDESAIITRWESVEDFNSDRAGFTEIFGAAGGDS